MFSSLYMLSNHTKVPTSSLNEVSNSCVQQCMPTIIHYDNRIYNLYQNVEMRSKII